MFIKVVAVRHSKRKVFQKQIFHLTSTIYLLLRCSTEKQTQLTHPISLTFFSNFFSFDSCVFIFFMFYISSNNRSRHRRCSENKSILRNFQKFTGKHLCHSAFFNKVAWNFILSKKIFFTEHLRTTASVTNWTISCGIYLSFKSRHLELFCKIIIQLFSTGIFLGLWSRGPPCNFTEQLSCTVVNGCFQSFN